MSLTPEQFNILVTKDDLKDELEKFESKIDLKLDKILSAVDKMTNAYEKHEAERVSNVAAHDRLQEEIDVIRNQLKLSAVV